MHSRLFLAAFACLVASSVFADEAAIIAALKAKGVTFTETKGQVTGLTLKKDPGLTEADYQQIRQLTHLKSFSCTIGFDDAALKAVAGLPELELFSANGAALTDEGLRTLASFKALKRVAYFHPPKGLKGTGLSALAELPGLEHVTMAGSTDFADEGMAAIGKLTQLKELRTWHYGVSAGGLQSLQSLKGLKSLMLGQRLGTSQPPTLTDDTMPLLTGLASLESLSLGEARLSLKGLGQLKKLPHLKKLTLDAVLIPEAELAQLKTLLAPVEIKHTAPTPDVEKRITGLPAAK